MNKLGISEEDLLKKYKQHIDFLTDECDWITHFDGEDIISIVYGILMAEKVRIKISQGELYDLYSQHVDSLNLTKEQWVDQYGIPEIIHIIYGILQENC